MIKSVLKSSILFAAAFLVNFHSSQQDCPQGINLLPMYGEVKKCDAQIKADDEFLKLCDKQFKNRQEGAQKYVEKAWGYFYDYDTETSMKRFNQAWLLDKNNADVYWGFGNLMGMKTEFKKSVSLLKKSIKLNSHNPKVYESISTSYSQLFYETKNKPYLDSTIVNLKNAIKFDTKNAKYYGSLAGAYSYYTQKDSLRKYIKITDQLDPKMIHPEVRKRAGRK